MYFTSHPSDNHLGYAWGKKTSNHKVKRGVRMNGGCNRRAQDLRTSFTRLVRPIFGVGILIKFRLRCYMSELDGWKWALIDMSYRQYLPYYTLLTLLKCASMGPVFPFLLIERRIYIFSFFFVSFSITFCWRNIGPEISPICYLRLQLTINWLQTWYMYAKTFWH